MANFEISTPLRIRHFIAQLAHESGSFQYVREIASGNAYEGRKDLGNVNAGDGVKFKGRGLIQITGRANYEKCSLALFGDRRLLDNPELLELPDNAVKSAAWFWQSHGLNALADKDDIRAITKRINGGYNGLVDRMAFYDIAKTSI
ncbi:glycoside hydrolase family 19 protein [Williamwhitmania taraxaci]|nr:glycoside hydrolase family 19 protein [Williamwhitmania taraxaci]